MTTRESLLRAYDDQLRTSAEMAGCRTYDTDGPLYRGITTRGTGFVSYHGLGGLVGQALDALIERTVAYYRDETQVSEVEWKTRGHDAPADLGDRLVAQGLHPEPVETVMVGQIDHLVADVPLPDGVVVRRAGDGHDLLTDLVAVAALHDHVFGHGYPPEHLAAQIAAGDGNEMWLAEHAGRVVSAGRIVPVPGTEFAGIWGGATLPEWRGRGIYRALTSARARSARDHGATYVNSDCTDMSRPILERAGLVAVTTTTPYVWERR